MFSHRAAQYDRVAVKAYGLIEPVANDLLSLVLSGWGFASYGNTVEDGFSGLTALYNSWWAICYGLGWQCPDIQDLWNMLNSQDFLSTLSEYGPAFREKYQFSWGSDYCSFPNQLAVLVKMLGDQNGVDAQLAVCQGDSANNLNHTMEVWENPHNKHTAFTVFLHHNGALGDAGRWAGLLYRNSSHSFRTPDIYFRGGHGRTYHNMVDVSHAYGTVSELALRLQQPTVSSNTNADYEQAPACGQISSATSPTSAANTSPQRLLVSPKSSLEYDGFNHGQVSNDPGPEDFHRQTIISPGTALNKNNASTHCKASNGSAPDIAFQRSEVGPNTPSNKTNASPRGRISKSNATNVPTNVFASESVHWFASPENQGLKSACQAPKQKHNSGKKSTPAAALTGHMGQTKAEVVPEEDKNRRTRKGPMKMSREDREEADRRSAHLRKAWVELVCDAFAVYKQIDRRNGSSKQDLRNKLIIDLKIVEQQMREL